MHGPGRDTRANEHGLAANITEGRGTSDIDPREWCTGVRLKTSSLGWHTPCAMGASAVRDRVRGLLLLLPEFGGVDGHGAVSWITGWIGWREVWRRRTRGVVIGFGMGVVVVLGFPV